MMKNNVLTSMHSITRYHNSGHVVYCQLVWACGCEQFPIVLNQLLSFVKCRPKNKNNEL